MEKLTNEDAAFIRGVGYAIAETCRQGDMNVAESVFSASGISMKEMYRAGVEEFDRKHLRKISPSRKTFTWARAVYKQPPR